MGDSTSEPRAKRQKLDKAGRFAALEKLKKLKGSKHKCDVEEEVDNVYEIVDEKQYAEIAKKKYGDEDWIEYDGTGYLEDGRDFFEDEDYSDHEQDSTKKNKHQSKEKKKNLRDIMKPVSGKGSIRNLFSNTVPKKKVSNVKLDEDDVLADILEQLDDEKTDMKKDKNRRVSETIVLPEKLNKISDKECMNDFINSIKMKEQTQEKKDNSDDEMLDRILKQKVIKKIDKNLHSSKETVADIADIESTDNYQKHNEVEENDIDYGILNDDENQFKELPIVESEMPAKFNTNVEKIEECIEKDESFVLDNWEDLCHIDNFEEEIVSDNIIKEENNINEENLKFWYWDAWEDALRRPGAIFLFGKTSENKSICVHVQNINRILYLLPRIYLLDSITKEETDEKVTLADVYEEFNTVISANLQLKSFKSKKVTKNFGFHPIGMDVPQVCDYIEVHYDGKKPPPDLNKKYKTIAHIFGTNTSALERFLLSQKIKGPCWLNLTNFQINKTPISWCKLEITCSDPKNVTIVEDSKPAPPPPVSILAINVRTTLNPKTMKNEIVMISSLVNNSFHVDKPAPNPPHFTGQFCGFTRPNLKNWPFDLVSKLSQFKMMKHIKQESEFSLLSWFLAMYQSVDPDFVVTHDMDDCQLDVITDRIMALKVPVWSRLGRLRMTQANQRKNVADFFVGRLLCDIKISAEELIHSRSFDLNTLCEDVLHLKENERKDINEENVSNLYESGEGIVQLISFTTKDCLYIFRIMCELDVIPLALQITNICGNTMSRTLQGGRSERNEYLLLHAFTEKNYIVPDKQKRVWQSNISSGVTANYSSKDTANKTNQTKSTAGRKKAAYSGGLVLEPIRGLYEKYVLLMDFNSLYPSIIQEYNICLTTIQQPHNADDLPEIPDSSTEQGILPRQLRRLVESRREVKKLIATPNLEPELKKQYDIRQLALKLTANSMYGCLGFANSRFFAQHLAALVTHKGREILMNTKSLVQKLNYEVIYGDTDSIMINTNILDYDQVFKIGNNIKQSVNKIYKQIELDIDGVFKCLLLLKKKKYAAVKVSKTPKGELKLSTEIKGLEIVRRDWSKIAIMMGKLVLEEILSEKSLDEKIEKIHNHLESVRDKLKEGSVALPMFVITKQLSRGPKEFSNPNTFPHVQVALRMNETKNRRYKKGDMVDYIICESPDGNTATPKAYHLDELKSNDSLKVDITYYLSNQIHPVITRLCEVLDGTDASRIAESLGLDPKKYKAAAQRAYQERIENSAIGESIVTTSPIQRFRNCDKFLFVCVACKTENIIAAAFKPEANQTHQAVLQKCSNPSCITPPYQYVISIRNQMTLTIRKYITRFYQNWMVCDDPACSNNSRNYSHVRNRYRPICVTCKNGSLLRQYSEYNLYDQISYFEYMFDLSQYHIKNTNLSPELELAYTSVKEVIDEQLEKSACNIISLAKLFANFKTS